MCPLPPPISLIFPSSQLPIQLSSLLGGHKSSGAPSAFPITISCFPTPNPYSDPSPPLLQFPTSLPYFLHLYTYFPPPTSWTPTSFPRQFPTSCPISYISTPTPLTPTFGTYPLVPTSFLLLPGHLLPASCLSGTYFLAPTPFLASTIHTPTPYHYPHPVDQPHLLSLPSISNPTVLPMSTNCRRSSAPVPAPLRPGHCFPL